MSQGNNEFLNKKKSKRQKWILAGEVLLFAGMLVALAFFSWVIKENNMVGEEHGGIYYAGCVIILSCILVNCVVAILLISDRNMWEARKISTRSQFLANFSREVRTPLNAILGMNEAILRESTEDGVVGYASDIDNVGKSLLAFIDNVQDISRLDQGKLKLVSLEYSVRSLVISSVSVVEKAAKEKGLSLIVEVDSHMPSRLKGDEIRIQQIITNLLSNAIKFTKNGWVNFKVDSEIVDDERLNLVISVSDTGIGFKDADKEAMFDDFARIEAGKSVGVEGSGLGLSIVGRLVNLMHGEIFVKSTYGSGSTFTVIIPQKIMDTLPIGYVTTTGNSDFSAREICTELFTAPSARILAVDDVLVNLKVITSLLKKTRIKVDTAINGEECLELVKKNKYDIIFLDHLMPGKNGIETLHDMKDESGNLNRNTPVIMISANALSGAREEYLEAGFSDYIPKPFSLAKLNKILLKYLPASKIEDADASAVSEHEKYRQKVIRERRRFTEEKCFADRVPHIINKVAAKEACRDDEVLFNERIATFIAEDRRAMLESAYEKNDMSNYRMIVRSIRSSAVGIGALELVLKAVNVESEIEKQNDLETAHKELTDSYSRAITDIMHEKEEINDCKE